MNLAKRKCSAKASFIKELHMLNIMYYFYKTNSSKIMEAKVESDGIMFNAVLIASDYDDDSANRIKFIYLTSTCLIRIEI